VLVTELLTGRRPFPAADPTSFAAQAVAARTPPVIAAAVPPAVAAVLRACLSPDPAARPASAAVLAAELEKVVAAARTPAPRRWRRAAAAVAGVAAVAVVAVLAVALVLPQPTRAERPPVTAEEYFYRGWLAMKAEDWAGARSDFVTSDRLASNRWALALAAYCATSGGKHDEAIGLARWLDKETPGGAPPDVLNVLGHAYVQLSRHAEALPPLDRALLRESLPAAHYNRALARNRLRENPAGAADDMRVALAGLRPASFELHADAARAFAAASDDAPGLRAEALAHVRAALALGVRPEPLRGESAFRPRFRSGFGSGLAFEAALAAPRGPAPGKLPRLRLVEPVPF
jgi:tetratricopeptide (TPR) repeat protein